jgi:hypothetical protein
VFDSFHKKSPNINYANIKTAIFYKVISTIYIIFPNKDSVKNFKLIMK